jgi:hypothetical protein
MRTSIVEAAAIGGVSLALAERAVLPGSAPASWALSALGAGLLVIAIRINPRRWQLAPAGLVLLALVAQALIVRKGPDAPFFYVGAVLLLLSAALAWGLPAGRPPAPDGPFKVGVAESELTRFGLAPAGNRNLTIKLWYPATPEGKTGEAEPLWSELHLLPEIPGVARALLAYLTRIRTHSVVGANLAVGQGPFPLLIYNHSLLSFASENTLLMEQLASHGFVVLSIRHRDQVAEHATVQAGVSAEERADDRKILSRLRKASSREERALVSLELFRNSTGLSAIVRRRAEDTSYVLDHLDEVLARLPGGPRGGVAPDRRFCAIGLSLGGAVATQLRLMDARCVGVANLDGGLYGMDAPRALPGPYLMVYSQANAGTNDAFRGPGYCEFVLAGAKHLDLHDASVVVPGLKCLGLSGPGGGDETNLRLKRIVTTFFDGVMKGVKGAERAA